MSSGIHPTNREAVSARPAKHLLRCRCDEQRPDRAAAGRARGGVLARERPRPRSTDGARPAVVGHRGAAERPHGTRRIGSRRAVLRHVARMGWLRRRDTRARPLARLHAAPRRRGCARAATDTTRRDAGRDWWPRCRRNALVALHLDGTDGDTARARARGQPAAAAGLHTVGRQGRPARGGRRGDRRAGPPLAPRGHRGGVPPN